MSKKHFIALADAIREHNRVAENRTDMQKFGADQLDTLMLFCRKQNGQFNGIRWLEYVNGRCGPNGGSLKNKTHLPHGTAKQTATKV